MSRSRSISAKSAAFVSARAGSVLLGALLVGSMGALPAGAVPICNVQGCADFPQGALSFADVVVDYSPVVIGDQPTPPHREPTQALGLPDYDDPTGAQPCQSPSQCTWVTLGDGGSLTLRFTDNVLTGSGTSALDLWIFEIGGDVEDTFVEVSEDGASWHPVGEIFGSTAGVDLDAFGFGPESRFHFVRLTDDPNEGHQFGDFAGADIDAVGAVSTIMLAPSYPGR